MTDRKRHPSGKPERPRRWGTETRPRLPNEAPLTPGLKRTYGAPAIGFLARICSEDDDPEQKAPT